MSETPKNTLASLQGPLLALAVLMGAPILLVLAPGASSVEFAGVEVPLSLSHNYVLVCVLAILASELCRGRSLSSSLSALADWGTRHERALFWALLSGSTLYLLRIKLLQHWSFHTGAFDFALYDSALYNTLDGKFLFSDQLGRNFFSEHFSPVLLLFVPVYLIANTPITLLIIEVLGIVGAVAVLYQLCREYKLAPLLSALCGLVFLNYRYLAGGVMYDFHPELLEPAFLLGAALFALRGKLVCYWVALLLAFSCKEDVPIYGLFLGLYVGIVLRHRWTGAFTVAISIAWALLAWKAIIPAAMAGGATQSAFLVRWGHLGSSHTEIFLSLASSPGYVISQLFSAAPRALLASLAFIPLLGPGVLVIALPGVVLNVTSAYDMQNQLTVHYAAPIVPFVMWAFVVGISRIQAWATQRKLMLAGRDTSMLPVLLCLMIASATFGKWYNFHAIDAHVSSCREMLGMIPEGQVVAAQTGFIPHLGRKSAATILYPAHGQIERIAEDADFIALDTRAAMTWPLSRGQLEKRVQTLRSNSAQWELIFDRDGVVLFERVQYEPSPLASGGRLARGLEGSAHTVIANSQ